MKRTVLTKKKWNFNWKKKKKKKKSFDKNHKTEQF